VNTSIVIANDALTWRNRYLCKVFKFYRANVERMRRIGNSKMGSRQTKTRIDSINPGSRLNFLAETYGNGVVVPRTAVFDASHTSTVCRSRILAGSGASVFFRLPLASVVTVSTGVPLKTIW
jgi:hypothetical protein